MNTIEATMRLNLLIDSLVFRFTFFLVSRRTLLIKLSAALVLIPVIQHSSIAPLSNSFFYRISFQLFSSTKIAVVWFDLLGFALVFVDSLAFGIRDRFTLLLVRLQRECQISLATCTERERVLKQSLQQLATERKSLLKSNSLANKLPPPLWCRNPEMGTVSTPHYGILRRDNCEVSIKVLKVLNDDHTCN